MIGLKSHSLGPLRGTGRAARTPFGIIVLITLLVAACSGSDRGTAARSVSRPPENLLEGAWLAREIGGEAVVTGQPVLRFTSDDRADGSGGCNTFTGPVSIDGEAMAFGPLASTRKACLPALLDQEQKFFIALAGVRSFSLDGEQMILRDTAARPLIQLARGAAHSGLSSKPSG